MIMFTIAEWVANVLILGLGVFFWMVSLAIMAVLVIYLTDRVTNES